MMITIRKPSWWPLYLLLPLAPGLLLLESRLRISLGAHRLAESGIALLVYSLAQAWIRANGAALLEKEPVYTVHYTWLEERRAEQPLTESLEERALMRQEPFIQPPACIETFQSLDPASPKSSVMNRN